MQFDGQCHFDGFVLRDASQVYVQNFNAIRVPLDFAEQSGVLDIAGQGEHLRAVTNYTAHGFTGDDQVHVGFAVAIQYSWNQALRTQLTDSGRTNSFACLNFDCLNHALGSITWAAQPSQNWEQSYRSGLLETGKYRKSRITFKSNRVETCSRIAKIVLSARRVSITLSQCWQIACWHSSRHTRFTTIPLTERLMAKKSAPLQYIEPIGARVLVLKDEPKRETKGGIALPDAAEIPTITGRIVTISRQVAHDEDVPLRQ